MPVYWFSTFVITTTIVVLIACVAYTKITVQSIVALHSLANLWVMLISTLLVLSVHHYYGNLYPFHRHLRTNDVLCNMYSAFSMVNLFIPPTSLMLILVIHYRAVFWSRFNNKLECKHLVVLTLTIWLITSAVVAIWTSFHNNYSSWYCSPFMVRNSFAWVSVILQSVALICSLTSGIIFITCYSKMIFHVHKEEAFVKAARSKNISTTRQFVVKFCITCSLYAS